MRYRVVKVPLPSKEKQIEQLIRECAPVGYRLITMSVVAGEMILVYGKEEL